MPINQNLNSIVILEAFNNYFNRKIKILNDVDSYINQYAYDGFEDINFNPNDDVSTEIIFNFNKVNIDPDYLLVCENCADVSNDNPTIVSRWFVIESSRTRNGQYRLRLKRDVVADNFNALRTAPIFVQKAWLNDNDPFIFNSEGMSFNQVKIGEKLLKDATQSAWLVAYIARGETGTISVQDIEGDISSITISEIASLTGIAEGTITAMLNTDGQTTQTKNVYSDNKMRISFVINAFPYVDTRFMLLTDNAFNFTKKEYNYNGYGGSTTDATYLTTAGTGQLNTNICENIIQNANNNKTGFISDLSTAINDTILTLEDISKIESAIAGKVISYQGKYYRARISPADTIMSSYRDILWNSYVNIANVISSSAMSPTTANTTGLIRYYFKTQSYAISLTEESFGVSTLSLSASRNVLNNKEYDMLCMPYNDIEIRLNSTTTQTETITMSDDDYWKTEDGYYFYKKTFLPLLPLGTSIVNVELPSAYDVEYDDTSYEITIRTIIQWSPQSSFQYNPVLTLLQPNPTSKGDVCRRIASELGRQLGAKCYDVQLLPYCPLADKVYQGGVDSSDLIASKDYTLIEDANNAIVGICFYCWKDSFQVYINERIESQESSLKIENECNKYRLVSPNYQGVFDFSVAKNGGVVPSFSAFCTYKPFTPYIKVAPLFMNLYGAEYGDNRGLICGGDFSISRTDSAWVQYELNNKNYQNIFNRDIQNLDFNQNIEMRLQLLNASVGAVGDAVKGAGAGMMATGSPYGAIAGAVIGGATSAIGGAIDTNILAQQQREARSYMIDKFNYQLGNVKALPYTLTKISAFDINSKIFPFIEFYSCTQEEKEAFVNKIRYESMTVMRVGTISDFITPEEHYFKGELIRLEDVEGESHLFNAIYEEILKGVYIYE